MRLELDEIRVGNEVVARGGACQPRLDREGRALVFDRAGVLEQYTLHRKSFEQDFVFASLPAGRGELQIRVNLSGTVLTDRAQRPAPELCLVGESGDGFSVGQAVAYDRAGKRLPLDLTYASRSFEIKVPAEWVAQAELPITVDPVIGPVLSIAPVKGIVGEPHDVVYCNSTNEWLVGWTYDVGALFSDVRVRRVAADGALIGAPLVVDSVNPGSCSETAMSYAPGSDRVLMVWIRSGVVNSLTSLMGRLLLPSGLPASESFVIGEASYLQQPAVSTDGVSTWMVVAGGGFGRVLDMSGTTLRSLDLTPMGGSWPKVAYSGQRYVVSGSGGGSTVCRAFDASGIPVSPPTVVEAGDDYIGHVAGGGGRFFFNFMNLSLQSLRGRVAEIAPDGSVSFLTAPFHVRASVPGQGYPAYSWAAYSATNSEWYTVYQRGEAGGSFNLTGGVRVSPTGTVSLEDTIATPTGTYMPRVAWNSTTNEMLAVFTSTAVNPPEIRAQRIALGGPAAPPVTPSGFKATPGDGRVSVAWSTVPLASAYNVWRSSSSSGTYELIGAAVSGLEFVDLATPNETTWFYKVSALNSAGESVRTGAARATPRSPRPEILFVVGDAELKLGDVAAEARLRSLGFRTVLRKDSVSASSDAAGKALVVISSTVTSGNVNSKFRSVSVPLINWENVLHRVDYLGMAMTESAVNYGTETNQTLLRILEPGHPLAFTYSGDVSVVGAASKFSWGRPGSGAAHVASLVSDPSKVVIFGYEAGVSMPGLRAPARRVGFFLEDATMSGINEAGVDLFDAAVFWALGSDPGAPLPPMGLSAVAGNAQVELSWSPSSGATGYTVLRGFRSGEATTPVATGLSATGFTDLGLVNNQTYYYTVLAESGSLRSGPSNEAVATPRYAAADALFVVAPGTLGAGDAAVRDRLVGLGFNVVLRAADVSASSDAQAKALVVISSTLSSSQVNTKFKTAAVPVLTWESALFDDFGMTGALSGGDLGTATGQTEIDFVFDQRHHPLALGYTGLETVAASSTFSWGRPSFDAVIARRQGNPGRAVLFAYEAGAAMPGLTAPARRVGFFLEDLTASRLNSTGWRLFDAAVRWAADERPGTPPAPTGLVAQGAAGKVTLTWTASPGATGYRVKRATVALGPYAAIASALSPYEDASVSDGTTYYYVVTALAGPLESPPSNEAVATPGAAAGKRALLVVDGHNPRAGDDAVEDRLAALGIAVTRKDDADTDLSGLGTFDLVLISSSVQSVNVQSRYRDIAVPLINWENRLYDDLGMTGPLVGIDYGTSANQSTALAVNPLHPLAAGISGVVAVTTQAATFTWGVPGWAAQPAAMLPGNAGQAVIFGYETGATMPGAVAPARRVGFFLEDLTAGSLTPAGWALFDAAVRWALGLSPPPLQPPPRITAPTSGESLRTTLPAFRGTSAASGLTITVFVDGLEWGSVQSGSGGAWTLAAPAPLPLGSHVATATAADAAGPSPLSAPVAFVLEAGSFTIPAPTGVRTIGYADVVDVEWTPSASSQVAGYNVYRRLADDPVWPTTALNGALLVRGTRYRDATPVPGQRYEYRVTAVGVQP